MKKLILTILLALPMHAMGAGFQMRYQSAETMGTSFASDVSGAKTASGFFNNPALLMSLEDGIHASVELMGLFPMGDFENASGPDADGFASASFIPSLYYGQKFSDNMGVVVSFTVPWATNTDYDNGWAGANRALKTYLATYNLSPSFVYSVNEQLSVSVGPQVQFITGELSQATPAPTNYTMEGDHIGVGFTASALFKASDALRLGFNYKSRIKHTLDGNQSFSNPAVLPGLGGALGNDGDSVELEMTTPDVITLGVSYLLTEKWDLHGSFSWSSWSTFDELAVRNTSGNNSPPATQMKWDDTIFVAAGADYYHSDEWTFRGGLSYETGAPPDEYRTPRSVDSDRATIGLGASYTLNEMMTINGALTQLFYTSAPTIDLPANPPLAPALKGEYKGNMATAVRVGLSARF